MALINRDPNELRYNSIFLLPKDGNANYYQQLFKNFKSLALGMNHPELAEELDFLIHEKIERIIGSDINMILIVYKNLPTLNSFTKCKNPLYQDLRIYKYTLQKWLDEIEQFILQRTIELEPEIRFTLPSKQFI